MMLGFCGDMVEQPSAKLWHVDIMYCKCMISVHFARYIGIRNGVG